MRNFNIIKGLRISDNIKKTVEKPKFKKFAVISVMSIIITLLAVSTYASSAKEIPVEKNEIVSEEISTIKTTTIAPQKAEASTTTTVVTNNSTNTSASKAETVKTELKYVYVTQDYKSNLSNNNDSNLSQNTPTNAPVNNSKSNALNTQANTTVKTTNAKVENVPSTTKTVTKPATTQSTTVAPSPQMRVTVRIEDMDFNALPGTIQVDAVDGSYSEKFNIAAGSKTIMLPSVKEYSLKITYCEGYSDKECAQCMIYTRTNGGTVIFTMPQK